MVDVGGAKKSKKKAQARRDAECPWSRNSRCQGPLRSGQHTALFFVGGFFDSGCLYFSSQYRLTQENNTFIITTC